MALGDEIPKHIKDKVWIDLGQKIPYRTICERWCIKSTSSVSAIKKEYLKLNGLTELKKPITPAERQRRKKIGIAAVTIQSFKKAEFISEGFINTFEVLAYNAGHLFEIIDHSRDEADSLKAKQEEILEGFKKYVEMSPEQKVDVMLAIRQSIQKMNDFLTRDMIRMKAVGELRKQIETFLKLKAEIMDVQAIKGMLDAFFKGCDELDDNNYKKYRDSVVKDAPFTSGLFAIHEQKGTGQNNSDIHQQE